MRFSKHVLPIAILLTGVIAAKDEESTTAVEKAKATEDKPSKTTADDSESNTAEATEEASATATGKDGKDKDSKTDKSDTKSGTKDKETASKTSTSVDGPTITWDPPAPKTTVPDINAGSPSPMTPGVLVLSLVFGITSLGMALL
ncbi:hypothetical protein BKA59DRAFT_506524 [Fusarium tricinctum]|jgi:cytoskeletal protein RodZ|uniref:Cell wall protein n=2 Tax=Fusarium tricinctum species complex TaxID=679429 RepID=A0A8K0WJM5_9HYPO|nr:hypothetical protein BKA59DRAFT_506524 [Fusarium tricinctum]